MEFRALLRRCLVLTYACPPESLAPRIAPGLTLDTWRGNAFLAIAMVQTEGLGPGFLPRALGADVFMAGYRAFVRHDSRRGLHILRTSTDRRVMTLLGNFLTQYHYELCRFRLTQQSDGVLWSIRTPNGAADLEVFERDATPALPPDSPFETLQDARRFAGPLPITYGYDPATRSLVSVRGIREQWDPRPASVEVLRNTLPLPGAVLASAFSVRDLPYRWTRGTRIPLEAA
jgi:hypothetical protein